MYIYKFFYYLEFKYIMWQIVVYIDLFVYNDLEKGEKDGYIGMQNIDIFK